MANRGFLELGLIDVRGQPAREPAMTVTVFHVPDGKVALRSERMGFPPRRRFELPAFPQSSFLFCEIVPSRYRSRKSEIFRLTHDENILRNLTVVRLPKQWRAQFSRWNQLDEHFDPLKEILESSPSLRVRGWRSLAPFTRAGFDRDDGGDRLILPKAALLNLFFKMSDLAAPTTDGLSWFSFVREILEIGRERFIAIVDPRMGEIVRTIKSDIARFRDYKHTSAENHFKNFPSRYAVRKTQMLSIKSTEVNANLQLTLGPGKYPDGSDVLLLDADIDENGQVLRHLADVFKHKFTGGTHPYDIHEYLLLENARADLGYELT